MNAKEKKKTQKTNKEDKGGILLQARAWKNKSYFGFYLA